MRRRRRASDQDAPKHLREFDWRRWGSTPSEALYAWSRARRDHYDQNPDAWPHPFAVLGGFANVYAKIHGRKPPWPDLDEGHRGPII
ncbi:hypothetical protein ABE10_11000 [Bacillus toyonensis]|nr:hypothetical protein [Bacillus toyonensis]